MAFTANQIDLLGKIEELCDKLVETNSNMKELQKWLVKPFQTEPILSDTNSQNSHPTTPNLPETEKQVQEMDPNLAFFAARVIFGLTCPPPKLPSVELPNKETPQYFSSYSAPPEQFPDIPNLIHRLFAELHAKNMNYK